MNLLQKQEKKMNLNNLLLKISDWMTKPVINEKEHEDARFCIQFFFFFLNKNIT